MIPPLSRTGLVILTCSLCLAYPQEVKKIVDRFQTERTYYNGKLHSVHDRPSLKKVDGHKEWHKNGKLHRVNKPAIVYENGGKEYYVEGKLHKVDGPAIEWKNGRKEWWKYGQKHRKKNRL